MLLIATLFHNDGKALLKVSSDSGPVFSRSLSARGLAIGDFNNDGAVDVLVSVNDGAPLLLRNRAAKDNHQLGIKLVGTRCNRDAVGARISYQAAELKRSLIKVVVGSYLSSHDPRIVLGLGKRPQARLTRDQTVTTRRRNRASQGRKPPSSRSCQLIAQRLDAITQIA